MQWKQVLLWHMLVRVLAGVLAHAIIAKALVQQMEIRLQQMLSILLQELRVRVLCCCSLRIEPFQLGKALLKSVKPYCIICIRRII